jgi:hypothetical protein
MGAPNSTPPSGHTLSNIVIDTLFQGSSGVTTTKTGTYTALFGDIVSCNPTSAGFTVYLPSAGTDTNGTIIIKNITSSGNTIIIAPNSPDTIDGSSSYLMTLPYLSITLVSNGNGWNII